MRKHQLVWLIAIWILMVSASFAWNYFMLLSNNTEVVLNKSKASFEQIVTTRAWGSQHGGVYVPITTTTQPNPYLIEPKRDIETADGLHLTKINPAHMTRQISEINNKNYDVQFHITSLNLMRPENKADDWETKALNLFEEGKSEILELVETDSTANYRFMASLSVEESCLSCHASQGYKLGEIRGGISITFPAAVYLKVIKSGFYSYGAIHIFLLGLGIIGLIAFYTTQNKLFSIIKTKNNELSQINATKDKVFSIIAHDLRSPFNTILGYTDLLVTDYETLGESERKKYISEVYKSSKSAFALVENLLLWAISQRDKIEIKKKELNLKKLIDEALVALLSSANRKSISINSAISNELNIFADDFTMKTIIANLVSNAIKFTNENGLINIDANQSENYTEINIADNGVGIPHETIPKLFKADYSITTLGTNKEKGTGLGLVLCKELIEKNGGEISVESKVGLGTKFTLKIPKYTKGNITPKL